MTDNWTMVIEEPTALGSKVMDRNGDLWSRSELGWVPEDGIGFVSWNWLYRSYGPLVLQPASAAPLQQSAAFQEWVRRTPDVAAAVLDAIGSNNPESAHKGADLVLLSVVPADVRAAYERLRERSGGFWFA